MSQIYGKYFSTHQLSPSHLKILDIVKNSEVGTRNKEPRTKSLDVLELGSSSGYMTRILQQNNCDVTVVEYDKEDAKKASKFAKKTYAGDLDDRVFINSINGMFDVIIAADILEHLKNPENVLEKFKKQLNKNGRIIISLPNIACWRIRRDLFVRGNFEYQEWGILDKTHLRFYTYFTIQKMIEGCGLKVLKIYPFETDYPFSRTINKIPLIGKLIDKSFGRWVVGNYPNLCVSHMVIESALK